MKKSVIRVLSVALIILSLSISALGLESMQKQIGVSYGVSLKINGETPTLTDVNGNKVYPFVYNGTTYVPIRAVSENLGADVTFDAQSKTASVEFSQTVTEVDDDYYVQKMAFYKILADELNNLEDLFSIFVDDFDTFFEGANNTTWQSPIAHELSSRSDVESHYDNCKELGYITADDTLLMIEYRRLEKYYYDLLIYFRDVYPEGQGYLASVPGSSLQNFKDATFASSDAESAFWETYQSAFK